MNAQGGDDRVSLDAALNHRRDLKQVPHMLGDDELNLHRGFTRFKQPAQNPHGACRIFVAYGIEKVEGHSLAPRPGDGRWSPC